MLVLCAETSRANGTVPLDDWLLHPVEPSSHGELRTVCPRTLIMTRDFPDIRLDVPIEGVLSRFAQSGTTGRRLWYLVQRGGQTAGCLLLADHEDLDRCELIYMGLVPEFRGQGGGRVLVYRALEMTRQLGRSNLVAVVDAENDPALAAYAVNGFEPLVRRCLFVRWLGSPGELSGV
jgi:GNAT superfamily N-acetyltransferase